MPSPHRRVVRWPALALALACVGCEAPGPSADVYVSGWVQEYGAPRTATLWKNGEPLLQWSGIANGVTVSGERVYVAGAVETATTTTAAVLWEGGQQLLSDGTEGDVAEAVAVSGGGVYVAGHRGSEAVLWIDGVAQILPRPLPTAAASEVAVVGGDVYVVGTSVEVIYPEQGGLPTHTSVAMLWINGVATALPGGGASSGANAVLVVGTDVYVGGYVTVDGVAKGAIWKNGVLQPLVESSGESSVYGLAFSDGRLYACGALINAIYDDAMLWIDGAWIGLGRTPGATTGAAYAAAVVGSIVYVVGQLDGEPTRWTNGTPARWGPPGAQGTLRGIAVVPH